MAEEYRTIMYSIREGHEVIVHKLPWNANDPNGMAKLQKLVERGFTFEDPRKEGTGIPEVLITKKIEKPEEEVTDDVLSQKALDELEISGESETITEVKIPEVKPRRRKRKSKGVKKLVKPQKGVTV